MIHSNIDRRDAEQISKAPFTFNSTLQLDNSLIPAGSFLSLKLYAEDMNRIPFRIYSISQDGKVTFCDSDGQIVAYWQTYAVTEEGSAYVSSLLRSPNGIIAGHICCTLDVVAAIRNLIDSTDKTYYLPADAFVLLPQCHVAVLGGVGRSFTVQTAQETKQLTGDLVLKVADDSMLFLDSGSDICISILNTASYMSKNAIANGICTILVEGETVWSHTTEPDAYTNLIIKAGVLSNLRVSKKDAGLVFTGVLNA